MHDPKKLKKRWEFQRAYQKGNKYWNRYFVIYVFHNHFNNLRLGITVSKKVGKSVQRNRVKRLIRESFRQLRPRIKTEYDIVVVGRTPARRLTCQEAKDGLFHLFRKAFILNNPPSDTLRQGRNDGSR
ncbi:ribonuclease P protein component [Candidatus Poribacteria bacterium]|nr:ribonuclease P protein component [Candidatus Poribacteria bacterium]MXV82114.1 ribonuclease P protein component [Candidatus Poribacteria bacterium]MYA55649.1 ribonuclease P protein component [Candidatus Poribacteria bacterium]